MLLEGFVERVAHAFVPQLQQGRRQQRVLGVAGPALAHWLLRYGFAPTIVERAATPRAGGQYEEVLRPYVRDHQKLPGGGLRMMAPMTQLGTDAGLAANRLLARPLFRPLLAEMMPADDKFVLPQELAMVG